MPVKQDAQKEKEALERLARQGVDVKNDPNAQRKVYEEAYGTYEPTFNKEFGLDRKDDRIDATPRLSQLKQRAGDRANQLRTTEDANIADAFQVIKDPTLRENLMSRSMALRDRARENNLGDVMQSFQLDEKRTNDDYQRALERALGVEKQRAGAYEMEKAEEAAQAQREFDLMMKQLSGGGKRGGGRRGGKAKKGKFTRETNEVGGYSFFDPDGNPITAEEYAAGTGKYVNQVLSGSQDLGDQEFLLDYDQQLDAMQDREISPEDFRSSLDAAYPHIYGKAYDVERKRVPIGKKTESDEDPPMFNADGTVNK